MRAYHEQCDHNFNKDFKKTQTFGLFAKLIKCSHHYNLCFNKYHKMFKIKRFLQWLVHNWESAVCSSTSYLLIITVTYLFYRLSIDTKSLATSRHQTEYSRNRAVDIGCVTVRVGNSLKFFQFVNALVKN